MSEDQVQQAITPAPVPITREQRFLELVRDEITKDPELCEVMTAVLAMAGPWFTMLAGSEENAVFWMRRAVDAFHRAERRL